MCKEKFVLLNSEKNKVFEMAEQIKIIDATAWIKKYFNEASLVKMFLLEFNIGIKESIFNSNPTQIPSQFVAEMEISVPKISVVINKMFKLVLINKV